ncbi:c-type cytochrome [Sphingobacterium rhinopitheci]|uniref:c-type cytochrome n=1 Tax=Sphingobacterium rhinopitheci TaxID=2781960 RepID=UPI001F522322|nr:cytochrome c [Sphingobacterium rhinopitheci]MCI0922578.1 cytochrome c [Sphingobacterium rhinopitheci]
MLIVFFYQLSACNSNVDIKKAQYTVNGQKLYVQHCQNCHGSKGEGLGKLYPPLTDDNYFKENRALLSGIVKNGMRGEIIVNGEKYNQEMPANKQLTVVDIAYILTYITTNFGKSDVIYSTEEVIENLKNHNQL